MKHRVQVTVSDPNHSMVSKRNEQIQKFVRISGDQATAVARARTHFKNQGYRVHGAEHVGTVQEGAQQLLRKYMPGYAKRQIDQKMDAAKFGKTDADKDANFQRYKKVQDKIKEEVSIDEAWSQGNRNPQRGVKVGDKVRSYDFPGMHDDHYIEGHVVADNPHTYHIRVNRVVRGGKEIPTPAHMQHVEAPKGRGMFSNAYAVHKMMAKQQQVTAAPETPQGAAKTFSNLRKKS